VKRRKDILKLKTVHIGGVSWKISLSPKFDDQDSAGECMFSTQDIRIKRNMPQEAQVRALCHELGHALGLEEPGAGICEMLAGILIDAGVL